MSLGLTAATAADTGIYWKVFGSSMHSLPLDLAQQTTIISNEEVNMKIVKFPEESGLKSASKTIKVEAKEQYKVDFLPCY